MADDDVRYESKTVQAVRGTETRSIAKWEKAGWELVDRNPATLRTALTFRRPKPKVPWLLIAVAAGVVLVLAIGGGIASALHGGDDKQSKRATSAGTPSVRPSPTPLVTPTSEASESTATGDQAVTVANDKAFAALLHLGDSCDESIGRFAEKYQGQRIEFDGSIANVAAHGTYDTRYDILLAPGSKGPKSVVGPAFKFEDVNMDDLKLTGANQPDSIDEGDRLHLVAEVGTFNPATCIFLLDPVSTEVR